MKNKKRVFRILVLLLCLLMCIAPMFSCVVQAEEGKTVRVGYVLAPSFQEGGENEYKSGYGYEYLQKLAEITGWNYEYVYGTFTDLLSQLENGDVDLMGDLSYTPERAEHILYGEMEQGIENFYLYTRGSSSNSDVLDFSFLEGKRVGVSTDSYPQMLFKEWCTKRNVECAIVEFDQEEDRIEAMNEGRIDATVDRELLAGPKTDGWEVLTLVDSAPFYFGVSMERPDLLNELNEAQKQILSEDPYFNEELQERCVRQGSLKTTQLNDEEVDWLNGHAHTLKVGVLDGLRPLSVVEDGTFLGVGADLVQSMAESYEDYGLKFQTVVYEDYETMLSSLHAGEIDCAWPVYNDAWSAERRALLVSADVLKTGMVLVFEKENYQSSMQKLGILNSGSLEEEYAAIYYPDETIIHLETVEDAILALQKHTIDSILLSACAWNASENKELKELDRVSLPGFIRVGFAVEGKNAVVKRILDKGIYAVGEAVIDRSMVEHSTVVESFSLMQYFKMHPGRAMLLVVFVAMILLYALYRVMHERLAISRKEKEVYQRLSMNDVMTGVGNRRSYEQRLDEITQHPSAYKNAQLVIYDINGLKRVNDQDGRSEGDELIRKTAQLLVSEYGSEVYRIAGDEFAVIDRSSRTDHKVRLPYEGMVEGTQLSYGFSSLYDENGKARSKLEWKKETDLSLYEHKITKRALASTSDEDKLKTFVRGVSDIVDAKDAYTADHSHRVCAISVLLGRKMGLSDSTLDRLSDAAQLHDIGKISIPDAILQKPGRLSDDEFNYMKMHTVIGASLLADCTGWLEVAEIVRHHHERYDGKGYPDGLAAREIPIEARIIAIADSIDAMSSNRCYRKALDPSTVKQEVVKNLGKMYDPAIGNIALENWTAIEAIETDGPVHAQG